MPGMEDLRVHLAPYLVEGEKLIWVGRPDPARHFCGADLLLVPFSLLWGGFAFTWMASAVLDGSFFFVLWGVPFVAVGLYVIFGRFLYKASRKRRTVYGLTGTRALAALDRGSLSEVPLRGTPISQQVTRKGEHLTVSFGVVTGGLAGGFASSNTGMELLDWSSRPLSFYDVKDVVGLQNALRGMPR